MNLVDCIRPPLKICNCNVPNMMIDQRRDGTPDSSCMSAWGRHKAAADAGASGRAGGAGLRGAQEEVRAAREEVAALRRSNELLTAEAAGARDAVTDLLDRTSRAQVSVLLPTAATHVCCPLSPLFPRYTLVSLSEWLHCS